MNSTSLLSILLVDDDRDFRKGLQILLGFCARNTSYEFCIVGEAASVEQTLALTAEQHPALILLDLELPHEDGIAALARLHAQQYGGKVLVLSAHREDEWVFRAMQAGASGYVYKDCIASQLCEAIATVMKDKVYLAPEVATSFFRLFHFYAGRSLRAAQTACLSDRERQVLHWLVQGASNEEISQRLYVTVATVKAHLTSIFEKLGVRSRTQAIVKALKMGLVN